MNDPFENQPLPRAVLIGAGALIGVSLLLVGLSRVNGYGATRMPTSTVVAARDLQFKDRADGGVEVYDDGEAAGQGRLIEVLAPGTNGFVRGVMRGLTRERKRQSVGSEAPFRLTRWADGRLSLDDFATGQHVNLEVFGPTNAAAFVELLTTAPKDPSATKQTQAALALTSD